MTLMKEFVWNNVGESLADVGFKKEWPGRYWQPFWVLLQKEVEKKLSNHCHCKKTTFQSLEFHSGYDEKLPILTHVNLQKALVAQEDMVDFSTLVSISTTPLH